MGSASVNECDGVSLLRVLLSYIKQVRKASLII